MRFLLPALFLIPLLSCPGETVKDREGAVRQDRAAREEDARWIYNDIDAGFAAARKSGKPLLAVLRCVPCLACMGLDAQVIADTSLAPLLDEFVCLRIINANALNLTKFQFDYDLSLSILIFNGDGTVYGRYGSWKHQKAPAEKTTAGLQATLRAALQLHRAYPANKAELAGKQGRPSPFTSPLEIPALAGRYTRDLDWQGKVTASCIHCHQIGDAWRTSLREQKQPLPATLLYPYPAPDTLGLALAEDRAATVSRVTPGSPAAAAGFLEGDQVEALAGQPVVSEADLSWILHHAGDSGILSAKVQRGGAPRHLALTLPAGWRDQTDISRRAGTWGLRGMAAGGLLLEDLSATERSARQLPPEVLALQVKHAGEYGTHAGAKNAGWKKGDILLKAGPWDRRLSEGELLGRLLRVPAAGDKVPCTVLRGTERLELMLPVQ